MFKSRPDEQDYARLKSPGPSTPEASAYGKVIDLSREHPELAGESLNINGDAIFSENPDRYKQHGFHFTADNCIACHACEIACQEKNELPPHLAFRKVGVIEGGSYPNVSRINISMACNHCEDPVCLKGCPTRAYTKYVEYGAVLQDPDICFGCGYCTWVCPYNAPYLDQVKGQVSKCNMCVDRLEAGLKPACVSACLGNALNFGVVEDLPDNREQARLDLPGFPDASISRPNIRFQQLKSMPRDFRRMDSIPIHYQRDDATGEYKTMVEDTGKPASWGIRKLSSRENPLVIFTLCSQLAAGALALLFLLPVIFGEAAASVFSVDAHPLAMALTLAGLCAAQAAGLFLSSMHLGKPQRFYRGFNNLRYSWICREALSVSIFFGLLGAFTLGSSMPLITSLTGLDLPASIGLETGTVAQCSQLAGWSGVIAGLFSVFAMNMAYQIKARPFWNHWHTFASFAASFLMLGSLFPGFMFGLAEFSAGHSLSGLFGLLAWPLLAGCLLQAAGLIGHLQYLKARGAEAAVSRMLMLTDFGRTYVARYGSLAALAVAAFGFMMAGMDGIAALLVWSFMLALAAVHELAGRAMFYVLVIPTTMPGDFFWRNKGFEEHARETGLADMPQVGVLAATH